LYLFENGNTLILANYDDDEAFIYNRRGDRVEKIGIKDKILWYGGWPRITLKVWFQLIASEFFLHIV
jgi:hypothetical protein